MGITIHDLHIGGAAASSRVWNQIIASVVNKRVVSLTQSHTEVLGAALLAGVGLGLYESYHEAVAKTVVTGETFEPDYSAHLTYSKLFPMYKQLYQDTKHHFQQLVKLDLPQGWVRKSGQ